MSTGLVHVVGASLLLIVISKSLSLGPRGCVRSRIAGPCHAQHLVTGSNLLRLTLDQRAAAWPEIQTWLTQRCPWATGFGSEESTEAKMARKLSAPGPRRLCAEGTWVQTQRGGK